MTLPTPTAQTIAEDAEQERLDILSLASELTFKRPGDEEPLPFYVWLLDSDAEDDFAQRVPADSGIEFRTSEGELVSPTPANTLVDAYNMCVEFVEFEHLGLFEDAIDFISHADGWRLRKSQLPEFYVGVPAVKEIRVDAPHGVMMRLWLSWNGSAVHHISFDPPTASTD